MGNRDYLFYHDPYMSAKLRLTDIMSKNLSFFLHVYKQAQNPGKALNEDTDTEFAIA